ncbi:nucleoside diphosphate-linked moiety X motif 8 isoform X1 [Tachysurus vachellii]|uniref:nucleoside diphosphate-linked moiety X motif 8 isoform X1 n=1 Tax=Tachysurus vachellii TaxID=175792 RepID=UPI00296B1733|nr:nucleoside diphosphate-linked moiety X motif 8 isoform X1 [Tachysurus vachellii]
MGISKDLATSVSVEKLVYLCPRMFRSARFVTSACLLGTHRSLFVTLNNTKKNLGKTVYNNLLSQPFCMVSGERGPHKSHHYLSVPNSSKYVSQKPFCINTSCSINPAHAPGFRTVRKITIPVQYCSYTNFSDHFILRACVLNKCLLPENNTSKHRRSTDKCREDLNRIGKSTKSYHDIGSTSFTKSHLLLNHMLWTSYHEQWRYSGPLKAQTCGLHRRVPQQAAFEDCLSAKNEERCREHLHSNTALYEKKKGKSWAAVLVSLCTVGGEPALLFTLRSSTLRGKHKGDVSFAGGKQDPSDRNIVETALREAREELGIDVNENEVWGVLKPLNDSSGMMIAPVLANLGPLETLSLRPNPNEVDEIFTLSVAHLCNPQNQGYTHFRTGNRYGYTLPVFHSDKYRIWGLTAIALDHTLKLLMPA